MASRSGGGGGGDTVNVAAARSEMRELTKEVNSRRSEYTSTQSDKLVKALDTANKHYEVLKTDARGAAIDASFLSTTSMLGAEQAGNLEKQTPERYVRMLLAQFGFSHGRAIKWNVLAEAIEREGIFVPVPACTFQLRKFVPPEKKERKERKRKESAGSSEPQQHADQIDVHGLQEADAKKAQVVRMKTFHKAINKHGRAPAPDAPPRVNLFRLLVHPTSFSQTVENLFDLAFLIKDDMVSLHAEEDAVFVATATKPKPDEYNAGVYRKQNILSLDYPTYKSLVAKWCPQGELPLIGSRDGSVPSQQPAATQAASQATTAVAGQQEDASSSGHGAQGSKRKQPRTE